MSSIGEIRSREESAGKAGAFSLEQARKAFRDTEEWIISERALSLPEHEVEAELERQGREVTRLMLQAHLWERGTGRVGEALEVCYAGGDVIQKEGRDDPWQLLSIFGEVEVKRTAYAAAGRESVHPLDEEIQKPKRSFSYELQRRAAEEVVRGPFAEAVASLARTTGNVLSKRSVEQMAADAAGDFDDFYVQRAAPAAEQTGPILVGAVDCKGVPVVKAEGAQHSVRLKRGEKANRKKMATVAAVFTQQPRRRTAEEVVASLFEDAPAGTGPAAGPEHKRVWASLGKSKDEVIGEMAAEMAARDPGRSKKWAVVTDGERALQQKVRRLVPGITLILDLLHVLEKLWSAAYSFQAEGSEEAKAWVRGRVLAILQGGVSQVVKGMRQSATKRGLKGAKRKVVDAVAAYFLRNRERMRYDLYLAQGLPIASGAVEGACKNLVKDRMERSGMRWQVPGAEAILRLRAIKLSGDMDKYWPFHIAREQMRLYGSRTWKVAG